MRKLILCATTLLISFSAGAADTASLANWNDNVLKDDWRVSQVLDGVVLTRERAGAGEIHDVLISESGYIQSLIVRRKPAEDKPQLWETDKEFLYYEVDWTETDFNPAMTEVIVEKTFPQIQVLPHREDPSAFQSDDEYEASKLLGMRVDATDVAAYGEIDDLMFSRGVHEITAFIVDLGGKGTNLFAVPADMSVVDYPGSVIELPYKSEKFGTLGKFKYDDTD